MVAKQENGSPGAKLPREGVQRKGMSWAAMLAWVLGAFVIAGLVAYRLVVPFFHHG